LLAALAWAASAPSAGAYQSVHPDLDLVPHDATVVVSVRCAVVADKIGFDADPGALEAVALSGMALGLRAADVERVTAVFHTTWQEPVIIVRTVKPVARRRVLGLVAPYSETGNTRSPEQPWYAAKNGDTAIHFADDRTFAYGTKASIPHCLDAKNHAKPAPFEALLTDADKHDALAWSAAVAFVDPPGPSCSSLGKARSAAPVMVASYKRPCGDPPIERPKTAQKRPRMLFQVPVPLPEWVESVSVTVDLGDEVVVEGKLTCTDAASARQGEKLTQLGLDAARTMALMLVMETASIEALEGKSMAPEAVLTLVRRGEKALQTTHIARDGSVVSAVAKLPADCKQLGAALRASADLFAEEASATGCARGPASCGVGGGMGTTIGGLFGSGVYQRIQPVEGAVCTPAGPAVGIGYSITGAARSGDPVPYPPPPPPSVGTSPVVPAAASQPATSTTPPPHAGNPVGPNSYVPSPVIPSPMPPAPSYPLGAATGPFSSQPATSTWGPPQPMSLPPVPAKFTVANVKKEAALLFTEGGGKLTFVRNLPAGEAVDLESAPNTHWIAIFTDKPAGTSFTVARPGEVVLLR
jgi:hypothetical protein